MAARIRKGDRVIVIAGRDKGKIGDVISVDTQDGLLLVNGVQMVKRHTKPTKTESGGIKTKESFIHISNVALIDPKKNVPTRVGFRINKDGKKVRFSKKTSTQLDS